MSNEQVVVEWLVKNNQAIREMTRLARGFDQVEQSEKTASRAIGSFAGNLAAMGIGKIIDGLRDAGTAMMSLSDSASEMEGKLRLATDRFGSFAAAQRDVAQIARDSRSDLSATASLYSTITREAASLGITQKDIATTTQVVGQTLKISGANAQESAGAIRQLSQALASGTLRGDEFNSVNEAAPRLMQLLADSMGKPKGELRALAAEGKLTSDILIKALTDPKLAAQIKAEFAKIPVTFSDISTAATNTATVMAGAFSKGFGLGDTLAEALLNVQNFATDNEATFVKMGERIRVVFNDIATIVKGAADVIGTTINFISTHMDIIRAAAIGAATGFVIYRTGLIAAAVASSAFGQAVAFNTSVVVATGRALGVGAAAQVAFTGATGLAATGFRAFTAALMANPLGLIAVAISAVVTALVTLTSSTDEATKAAMAKAAADKAVSDAAMRRADFELKLADMTEVQKKASIAAANAAIAKAKADNQATVQAYARARAELALARSMGEKDMAQAKSNTFSNALAIAGGFDVVGETKKANDAREKAIKDRMDRMAAAYGKGAAQIREQEANIRAAEASITKVSSSAVAPTGPSGDGDKKKKSSGMTEAEKAAQKYADAVRDLNEQIRELGYTEEQQALAADLKRAGLSGDITETGKKADEIRKLHQVIADGDKQRGVTKVIEEYDQAIKEAGMSTEQLALVEGRRRAGLSTDLTVITDQTKAIDARTLALYRAQQAQRVDDYVARVNDDMEREKADQAAIRNPDDAENIRLKAQYEERVRLIQASRDLTQADKDREIQAETGLYQLQQQTEEMRRQAEAARGLSDFMVRLWDNPKEAMKQFFKDLMKRLLEAILRAAILGEKLGGGKGIGGMIGSAVLGALGIGARATGGSVKAGKPYYINEKGKEMFIPGRSGEVIDAKKTRQMMGGGGSFTFSPNYQIQFSGNAQQDNMTLAALKAQTAAQHKQIRQQQKIRGWQ